ncbi:hypothetical protein Droror1_Dr00008876 [Drosera rotundifolia]
MGSNYKAALVPQRIRETLHVWKKSVEKKRRHGHHGDDSTIRTKTSTVMSLEDYDDRLLDIPETSGISMASDIELQPTSLAMMPTPSPVTYGPSTSRSGSPLLGHSASMSSSKSSRLDLQTVARSSSMPARRG